MNPSSQRTTLVTAAWPREAAITGHDETGRGQERCPVCKRATEKAFRPFCSARCADIDLARWLNGAYAIPIVNADDDEDGEDAQQELAGRRFQGGETG